MQQKQPKVIRGHIAFRGSEVVAYYLEETVEEPGALADTLEDWKARKLKHAAYDDLEEFNRVLAKANEDQMPDSNVLTIDGVLADPATHTWLKDALRSAMKLDPIDAAANANTLAVLLTNRADGLLKSHLDETKH